MRDNDQPLPLPKFDHPRKQLGNALSQDRQKGVLVITKNGFPQTRESWRLAVELAEFYLHMQRFQSLGRQFGLLNEAGLIDAQRCTELLAAGETMGFKPRVLMNANLPKAVA